jgi:hypothetical protein
VKTDDAGRLIIKDAMGLFTHADKHIYSHDPHASEAILLILFMVFNLLSVYLYHCQNQLMHYPGMKQTRVFALRMMRWLMIGLAFSGYV